MYEANNEHYYWYLIFKIANIDFQGSETGSRQEIVPNMLTGASLILSQLKGLLAKRMIYTWRRKTLYSFMIMVPIGMAVLTVLSLNP